MVTANPKTLNPKTLNPKYNIYIVSSKADVDVKQLKQHFFKSPYFSENLTVSCISYSVSRIPYPVTLY